MTKEKIVKALLPILQHSKFVSKQEKIAQQTYDLVIDRMITACIRALRAERLAKSDGQEETELHDTWIHSVPKMSMDISAILEPIMDKYMLALKYALLGSAAGENAIAAVKELGIFRLLPKGLIIQSFADAIDSHKDYLGEALQITEPKINKQWIDYSLKFIKEKSGRFIDKGLYDAKSKALAAIEQLAMNQNFQNTVDVAQTAHQLSTEKAAIEEKRNAVKQAVESITERKLSVTEAKQALKDSFKDYSTNWNRIVNTELGMASGTASAQAILDVASRSDSDPIICIINIDDAKVSKECKEWSREKNNEFKYYRLSSLKPPGYNIGLKKNAWENSFPARHINCRCQSIYVPKGYKVDKFGSLVKLKEGEEITIS